MASRLERKPLELTQKQWEMLLATHGDEGTLEGWAAFPGDGIFLGSLVGDDVMAWDPQRFRPTSILRSAVQTQDFDADNGLHRVSCSEIKVGNPGLASYMLDDAMRFLHLLEPATGGPNAAHSLDELIGMEHLTPHQSAIGSMLYSEPIGAYVTGGQVFCGGTLDLLWETAESGVTDRLLILGPGLAINASSDHPVLIWNPEQVLPTDAMLQLADDEAAATDRIVILFPANIADPSDERSVDHDDEDLMMEFDDVPDSSGHLLFRQIAASLDVVHALFTDCAGRPLDLYPDPVAVDVANFG